MGGASKTFTTAGGLFVDDGGTGGTPVLFIHSAAGSTEHWTAQLAHLRGRGRRAIAVDLRGHGRSKPPADGDYAIAALAGDLEAVLEHLGLSRVILVGHSLGGTVAAEFAGRHPGRVAGLLLLDPASDGRTIPDAEGRQLMAALEADAHAATEQYWSMLIKPSTEAVRERLFDGLRRTRPEAIREPLRDLLSFDPAGPLSRYRGPRLSIISALGEVPGAYHVLAPDLPHRKMDGVGHWLHFDRPDEINRLIDEFLAGVN
jgi:pimeloyl-ACP methyl ester carboxylesterase